MSNNIASMTPEVKKRLDILENLKRENLELKGTVRSIRNDVAVMTLKNRVLQLSYRSRSATNSHLEQDLTENIKKYKEEYRVMNGQLNEKLQLVALLNKHLSMQDKSDSRLDRIRMQLEKLGEKVSQHYEICKNTVVSKAESYCLKVNETTSQSSRMLKVVNYNISSTTRNSNSSNSINKRCLSSKIPEPNQTYRSPQDVESTIGRHQTKK